MTADPTEFERVQALIQEAKVQFINLQFSDIVGIVKQVSIPTQQWPQAVANGIWFDGSSVEGFARIAESDMFLKPDLSTFAVIPWERDGLVTARVICDVYTPAGEPFAGDPRYVLKRALAEAEAMGYVYNTGPELEFFLFRRDGNGLPHPKPHDHAGYFDVSTDLAHNVRRQMVEALHAFGIEVEAAHHEVAMGQHEIDFHYGPALQAADNAVTFRIVLKAIAQRNDLFASFMPKPIAGINGSGMHTHQSFMHVDTGENGFFDADDPYGLSSLAKHFIAGQLAHARGMAAVIAPLVNSYKRLVPGYEAPVYLSWARINRSALIRVPQITPGNSQATRLELRCPDPSCNPYLAFAVMLHTGIEGIRQQLEAPEPAEEDLYELDEVERSSWEMLPANLGEALDELRKDTVVQEALGPHVYHRYLSAKTQEWDEYRLSISQWELDRYLPIY
jgi:glutamine synthetase